MEQSIELLDFETVDQMVQIHGTFCAVSDGTSRSQERRTADYEGVSMTQRDAHQKAAAKEATNIFQNHYPEFLVRVSLALSPLYSPTFPPLPVFSSLPIFLSDVLTRLPHPHPTQSRKFFINVPTLLTWVFWLFKPLLSAATLAKMSVVGTGAKTIGAELSQVIPRNELPKRYGGEADAAAVGL